MGFTPFSVSIHPALLDARETPLFLALAAADTSCSMSGIDWDELDVETLASELRATLPPAEAEKMVWAFEQALSVARLDADLLRYLLAAVASLLAGADDSSPRAVFEAFFRRSVSDDEWRERYAGLFA
jgi:hypothetical protein